MSLELGLTRLSYSRSGELAEVLAQVAQRARARRIVRLLERQRLSLQERFMRKLSTLFRELGARVADAAGPILDKERDIWVQEKAMAAGLTDHQIDVIVRNILTSSRLNEWANSRLSPSFRDHWQAATKGVAATLIEEGVLTNMRASAIQRVVEEGGRRVGMIDIAGDSRSALFRAIGQASEEGLNPRQTARLIRDFIPEGRYVNAGSAYRAELIARTETLHAQRMASLENYKSVPTIQHVIAFDGDKDDVCAGRNGTIFTLDDAEMEAASTHPNCILTFGPVAA